MAKYPAPSPTFIKARYHGGRQTPKAIVMHGTVTSDNAGTARNVANWWAGPTSPKSSAHYTVDSSKNYRDAVIQSVGDHTIAYHCGYNTGSIGVELCDEQTGPASRWNDKDSRAIIRRAARLVAELCLAYGIEAKKPSIRDLRRKGPHGIYGHNDSRLAFGHTSHTDPRQFPWRKFMRLVRKEIRAIVNENKKPTRGFRIDDALHDLWKVNVKTLRPAQEANKGRKWKSRKIRKARKHVRKARRWLKKIDPR